MLDGAARCDIGAFEGVFIPLAGTVEDAGDLVLSWAGVGDWAYELLVAVNAPAGFSASADSPIMDNSAFLSTTRSAAEAGLGDPDRNVFYRVQSASYGGSSEVVGAFTFGLVGGGG